MQKKTWNPEKPGVLNKPVVKLFCLIIKFDTGVQVQDTQHQHNKVTKINVL